MNKTVYDPTKTLCETSGPNRGKEYYVEQRSFLQLSNKEWGKIMRWWPESSGVTYSSAKGYRYQFYTDGTVRSASE